MIGISGLSFLILRVRFEEEEEEEEELKRRS
jgi:hypothetical protein